MSQKKKHPRITWGNSKIPKGNWGSKKSQKEKSIVIVGDRRFSSGADAKKTQETPGYFEIAGCFLGCFFPDDDDPDVVPHGEIRSCFIMDVAPLRPGAVGVLGLIGGELFFKNNLILGSESCM